MTPRAENSPRVYGRKSSIKRSPHNKPKTTRASAYVDPGQSKYKQLSKSRERRDASGNSGVKKASVKPLGEANQNLDDGKDKFSIKVEYASQQGATQSGKVLLVKWVDYSSKYGVGGKMSNGSYVVLFNDSTKMVLNENNFDFVYIRRERERGNKQKEALDDLCEFYNFADYPEALKKKVILIQHFKSYLDGVKFDPPTEGAEPQGRYWDVFIKKWKRANKAILFRLSNKVIQVIFQDTSELILSSGSGDVTFITSR